MKSVDAFVGDYTEALLKNPQATVYENLAPIISQVFEQALEAAAAECDRHETFLRKEAHTGGAFQELINRATEAAYNAQRIRALKNKGA